MNCNSSGNCVSDFKQQRDGTIYVGSNPPSSVTIQADGSFGPATPTYTSAMGNDGNMFIINHSFEDTSIRAIIVGVKCSACTGGSAMVEGNWNMHLLTSGDSPQWTGWAYGAVGVDGFGNAAHSSFVRSNGDTTLPPSGVINVSADRIVTTTGASSYHGTLSQDNELLVGTESDGGGGYILSVAQKTGATYAISDMAGTWNYVGLISGDAPAQIPGWYWGAFTFDVTGTATSATVITDSLGNSSYTPVGVTLSLGPDGTFSLPSPIPGSGFMNGNKDMIVSTSTMAPGAADAVSGYNLMIGIKAGGSFTTADLAGDWIGHLLTAGDSPQYTGWAYFETTIDASGNGVWTEATRSNGDSTLPSGLGAFSLSTDGILSVVGMPSIHGVMTQDKRTFVFTMDDGGGGYNLMIMQKK